MLVWGRCCEAHAELEGAHEASDTGEADDAGAGRGTSEGGAGTAAGVSDRGPVPASQTGLRRRLRVSTKRASERAPAANRVSPGTRSQRSVCMRG